MLINRKPTTEKPEPKLPELLSPERVSELTGCRVHTLQNWRTLGKGPAYLRLGRKIWYQLSDVLAWMESQRRGGENNQQVRTPIEPEFPALKRCRGHQTQRKRQRELEARGPLEPPHLPAGHRFRGHMTQRKRELEARGMS